MGDESFINRMIKSFAEKGGGDRILGERCKQSIRLVPSRGEGCCSRALGTLVHRLIGYGFLFPVFMTHALRLWASYLDAC